MNKTGRDMTRTQTRLEKITEESDACKRCAHKTTKATKANNAAIKAHKKSSLPSPTRQPNNK